MRVKGPVLDLETSFVFFVGACPRPAFPLSTMRVLAEEKKDKSDPKTRQQEQQESFDWVQLRTELDRNQDTGEMHREKITTVDKFKRKFAENPFIPIGARQKLRSRGNRVSAVSTHIFLHCRLRADHSVPDNGAWFLRQKEV